MTKKITNIIIIATLAIWLIWDIYAVSVGPGRDEISSVILEAWVAHPQIVAMVFYLMGHLFWPQKVKKVIPDFTFDFPDGKPRYFVNGVQTNLGGGELTKHTCVDCGRRTTDPWKVGSRQPLCKGCFFDLDGKGQQ